MTKLFFLNVLFFLYSVHIFLIFFFNCKMARAILLAQKSSNFDNSNLRNRSFASTVERMTTAKAFVMGIRSTSGRRGNVCDEVAFLDLPLRERLA